MQQSLDFINRWENEFMVKKKTKFQKILISYLLIWLAFFITCVGAGKIHYFDFLRVVLSFSFALVCFRY